MIDKLFYSFSELEQDLHDINHQMVVQKFSPEVIIGPGRGAYIPGVMLSHYWNVPFKGFEWQTRDGAEQNVDQLNAILDKHVHSNILLVDDINDTGDTLCSIMKVINDAMTFSDIRTATLFCKTQSQYSDVDFYARELTPDNDPWIVFPYEEWWK